MARMTIVGADVAAAIAARKAATVARSWGDTYNSEQLCAFQRRLSSEGFCEAELVESMYGWSLRYASGLQDWGIIAGCRYGHLNGSWEDAVRAAEAWVAQAPARRWVTAQRDAGAA